ncbi:hypothetical protein LTR95_008726 [Oleoguttula sp. CCFEE 5521]
MTRRTSLVRSLSAIRDRFGRRRSDGTQDQTQRNGTVQVDGAAGHHGDAVATGETREETEGGELPSNRCDREAALRGRSSERRNDRPLVLPVNTPVEPARITANSVESQDLPLAAYAPRYTERYAEDAPHYLPQTPSSLRRAHTWHSVRDDEQTQPLRSLHIDGRLTPPNQQVIFDDQQPVKQLPTQTSTPGHGRKHSGLHENSTENDTLEEAPEPTERRTHRHVCRQPPCYRSATPENSCSSCLSVAVIGDVGSGRLSRRPRGYTHSYVEKDREAIDEHEYPETDLKNSNAHKRMEAERAHEKGKAMRKDRDTSFDSHGTPWQTAIGTAGLLLGSDSQEVPRQTAIGTAGLMLGSSLVKDPNVSYTANNLPGDLGPKDPRRSSVPKPQVAPQTALPAVENDDTPSLAPQPAIRPSPSSFELDTQSFNPGGSDPTPYGAPGNRGNGRDYPVTGQGNPSFASSRTEMPDAPPRQPSIAVSPLTVRPNGDMLEHLSPSLSNEVAQTDADENIRPLDDQHAEAPGEGFARLRLNQPPGDEQRDGISSSIPSPPHNDSVAEPQAVAPEPNRNIKRKEKAGGQGDSSRTTDQQVFSLRLPDSLISESPRMLDTVSMRDLYHQQIVQAVNVDRESGNPEEEESSEPPVVGDALNLWREESDDPFIDRRRRDSVLSYWGDPAKDPVLDRRRRDSVLSNWGDSVEDEAAESPTAPQVPIANPSREEVGTLSRIWGAFKDTLDVLGGDDLAIRPALPVEMDVKQGGRCRSGLFATGWGALRDALDNTSTSVAASNSRSLPERILASATGRQFKAANSRRVSNDLARRTFAQLQCSPSVTPRVPYSLECCKVPLATASTPRRRRRKRAGFVDSPSRKTWRGSPDIDPSYSTDEEHHATESTLGAHMDEAERSTNAETGTTGSDSYDSDDAGTSDIRRDSLVSNDSSGKAIAHKCDDIASGAPTIIGGLHFNCKEDDAHDGTVLIWAASEPGNFDRTPKSLEQAKRKLRKMVLTESPSSSNAAPAKPFAPSVPPAKTVAPDSEVLKAVSKAEKLIAPPFDLHAPFDPIGDAVKKSRQLIGYARDTNERIQNSRGSSGASTPSRSLSLRTKRDSVVTPKAKGKATLPLTPARQHGQADPHQLSPKANRLSSDDLFPDIYKSPVIGSRYRSPTTQERDRDLNDRLALNARKSAPTGTEVHNFATGSRNVSGLSEPGSLRDVLLKGAKENAPEGEGVEVHDFATGERDVGGLSEIDWCRTSSSSQSTPSKRSLGIQLKSGRWSIRAPKSSPIVKTSSIDAGLVNASMSRLYDVVSPVSTTSMRSSYSGQSVAAKENAAPAMAADAMLPAKLRVKRRKRSTPHFALD